MKRWLYWIAGWIIILLVYGVANLFLVGGQKLWHRGDEAKLDQLKAFLTSERGQIEQLESSLKACSGQGTTCENLLNEYSHVREQHKAEIKSLDALNKRVTQLESQARACIPDESSCEAQYGHYSGSVNTYNSEVRKANRLLARLTAMKPQLLDCAENVKQCENLSTDYSHRVDAYNARVDDANALAKKVGTYWYVVPVPKFGSHSSSVE
jgi:chromosome segregation ATPase